LKTPVSPVICEQLWSYILDHPEILFYELAEAREPLRIFDRRELQNLDTGVIQEPEAGSFTTYPYVPINKNGEMGSCSTYDTRQLVATDLLRDCNLIELEQRFGRKLILVGSQKLREYFLYPDDYDPDMDITHIQFCLLERIGRSRYSGEKTIGPHSLIELAKDSTLLFYQRSVVQKYGLVCKQVYIQKIADHHTAGVLLHLPRYYHEYKPQLIFTTEKVVEFLKTKPKFMADYDEVKSLLNSRTDGKEKRV
jgi:general transcription factor 3C polypeptide 1